MLERRSYVRSNGLVLVSYKVPDLQMEGKSSAFDISGAGLRITAEKKLELGTLVEMDIYLPGSSQPILAKGETVCVQKCKEKLAMQIAPQKEYFYVGIKFTVMDQNNKTRIINYVYRRFHQIK